MPWVRQVAGPWRRFQPWMIGLCEITRYLLDTWTLGVREGRTPTSPVTAAAIGAILATAVLLAPEGLSDAFRIGVFVLAAVAILLRTPIVLVVAGGATGGAGAGALGLI
jgi:hypothetical protein